MHLERWQQAAQYSNRAILDIGGLVGIGGSIVVLNRWRNNTQKMFFFFGACACAREQEREKEILEYLLQNYFTYFDNLLSSNDFKINKYKSNSNGGLNSTE